MRITHCRACNSPLVNRRAHATTCSSKCRNIVWRASKITLIPEKIMFSITNHALITKAASVAGKSINQYVVDRAVQTMESPQC